MITSYLSRIERLVLAIETHAIPVTIFTHPAPNLVHLSIDHFRYNGELPASFILSAPRLRTLRVRAKGEKDTLHLLELQAPLTLLSLGAINANGNTRHRLSAMIRVVSAQASSLVTLYLSAPNGSSAEVSNDCEPIILPQVGRNSAKNTRSNHCTYIARFFFQDCGNRLFYPMADLRRPSHSPAFLHIPRKNFIRCRIYIKGLSMDPAPSPRRSS